MILLGGSTAFFEDDVVAPPIRFFMWGKTRPTLLSL